MENKTESEGVVGVARGHLLNAALLVLLVFATYGPSLGYDFVWDDYGLIVSNEQIKTPDAWTDWMLKGFWELGENVVDPSRSFYRPLISLSYMSDYRLYDLEPRGFHVTNVLLHCVCVLLVYAVAHGFTQSRFAILAAALLFAVHPAHVENVSWISGRTDIACCAFFLGAWLTFTRWHRVRSALSLIVMTLLYGCALLSKEAALSFPLLVILRIALCSRRGKYLQDLALPGIALIGTTVLYLMVRAAVLGAVIPEAAFGSLAERLVSIPMVFTKYLGLLAGVVKSDPHHAEELLSCAVNGRAVLFMIVMLLYLITAGTLFLKKIRPWAFLVTWLPITLLPVMHLGALGDVLFADRFLYIPSVGVALLVSLLAKKYVLDVFRETAFPRFALGFGAIALVGLWAGLSRVDSTRWADNISLFRYMSKTSPESAYVAFNLGRSYTQLDADRAAIRAYRRAIKLSPDFAEARTNLGISLARLGQYREAIDSLLKGLQAGDDSVIAYSNLGEAYRALGEWDLATLAYRRSLLVAESAEAYNNLGECLLAARKFDKARDCFVAALRIEQRAEIHNNLALLHLELGDQEAALGNLMLALTFRDELDAQTSMAIHCNFARALQDIDPDQATEHAKRLFEIARETGTEGAKYYEAEWLLDLAD